MATFLIIFFGILFLVVVIVIVNLFRFSLNDFLEKTIKKFLWLWLPFHALGRLSKEFGKKYFK